VKLFTQTQGVGPDVVLLHGWGLHSGVWDEVANALVAQCRVTRIDLPGHGRSAACELSVDLSAVAAQLSAAVPAPAFWIGWSLGGLIALQVALSAPAAVRGLMVVAGSPCFVRGLDWPYAVEDAVLQQFARELERDFAATLARFLALQVRGSSDAGATLRTLHARVLEQAQPQPTALRAGLNILRTSDLRAQLGAITCPTHFVFGECDTLAPALLAGEIAKRMPAARSTVIRGAGHAPFVSHTAEFIDLVRKSACE